MNAQSGQSGDRVISTETSWLNQDDGGETGFRDKLVVVDGSSSKIHAA